MGLMRSLRLTLPRAANIRINAMCPWFVSTGMTAKLADQWKQHNLPVNRPAGGAEIIARVAADRGMNGKAVYVKGDRGWEVEGD
jgi:NAD(P)-dependent dehydrogenase (short-subunit alcohol dehydrogenase family)